MNWTEDDRNNPLMVMPEAKGAVEDILSPIRRRWMLLFLLLVALSAILLGPNNSTEGSGAKTEPRDSWLVGETIKDPVVEATPIPEDPYSKYDGQVVPHPRRQPDALVIIKISRYDPQLGGPNCFRWGWDPVKGYDSCLSGLSNGERWEVNYEISVACDQRWPYYTIVEIDGQLWYCKDHGGKIVEARPGVYWVDQLSKTGHYPHGFEMEASVWFPA